MVAFLQNRKLAILIAVALVGVLAFACGSQPKPPPSVEPPAEISQIEPLPGVPIEDIEDLEGVSIVTRHSQKEATPPVKVVNSDPFMPSQPPNTSSIVFVDDGRLHTSALDGSGVRSLVSNITDATFPQWSPDGNRITFLSGDSLYSVAPDGSDLREIANTEYGFWSALWSPSGSHIAIYNGSLFLIEPDGSNLTRYPYSDIDPQDLELQIYSPYGGPQHVDVGRGWWTKDGSGLAYIDGDFAINDVTVFNTCDNTVQFCSDWASYSYREFESGTINIYTTDDSGANIRQVTHFPTTESADNVYLKGLNWSPDGSRISFVRSSEGAGLRGYSLYTVAIDGTNLRHLSDASDVHHYKWSPDGSRIVFAKWTGEHNTELFSIAADGTDLQQLTHLNENIADFEWSPDGSQFHFFSSADRISWWSTDELPLTSETDFEQVQPVDVDPHPRINDLDWIREWEIVEDRIIVAAGEHLVHVYTVTLDGAKAQQLTENAGSRRGDVHYDVWWDGD